MATQRNTAEHSGEMSGMGDGMNSGRLRANYFPRNFCMKNARNNCCHVRKITQTKIKLFIEICTQKYEKENSRLFER